MVYRMGVMINRNAYRSGPEAIPLGAGGGGACPTNAAAASRCGRGNRFFSCDCGEQICAVGAVCSHYGAPLEEGQDRREHDPVPLACLAVCPGRRRVREGPACAPLPSYEVRVAGGQVQVKPPGVISRLRFRVGPSRDPSLEISVHVDDDVRASRRKRGVKRDAAGGSQARGPNCSPVSVRPES